MEDNLASGRLSLLACFAAFVVTFLVTRAITRMIRAGRGPFKNNVSDDGVHIHHAVPGVILLVTGAFAAVATDNSSVWSVVAGILVGIGTSLVLDEFALILHLDDVYWSAEGRVSVEMVSLAVAYLGLLVLGLRPFEATTSEGSPAAIVGIVIGVAVAVLWILVCVSKGKYRLALFGTFVPAIALVGAVRLAKPGSRWAARRYSQKKLERASRRASRRDDRYGSVARAISDVVAGTPAKEASATARFGQPAGSEAPKAERHG